MIRAFNSLCWGRFGQSANSRRIFLGGPSRRSTEIPVPLDGTNIDRNFRRSQHVLPLESKSYNSNQNPTVTSNSKNLSLPRAVPNPVSACFAGRRSTPTSTTVQIFARFFDLPFIMYMLLWLLHPPLRIAHKTRLDTRFCFF